MSAYLFAAVLHGCVLALGVFLVCASFKRLAPSVRAWLWWMVSAEFALGWLLVVPVRLPVQTTVGSAVPVSASPSKASAAAGQVLQIAHSAPSWLFSALVAGWVVGMVWQFARVLTSTLRLRRLALEAEPADQAVIESVQRMSAEMGLAAPPVVVVSPDLDSPAIFGLFRPHLFLPKDFDALGEREQSMALAHEMAHIRRKDSLWAAVPELATMIFWFVPVTYWARSEWVVQREVACDAEALNRCSCDPAEYGRFLLGVVERQGKPIPRPALAVTAEFRSIKRRLAALPDAGHRSAPGAWILVMLGVLALPVVGMTLANDGGLLVNSGFEQGRASPTGWSVRSQLPGVEFFWDARNSHSGTHSISIRKMAQNYFPIANWSQDIPYDGRSQAINFTGWLKADHAYKAVLDVKFDRGDGSFFQHKWVAYDGAKNLGDPPADHDWKFLGGTANIPTGTKTIVLSLQDYGPGQVWLDDVSAHYDDRVSDEESR